MASVIVIESGAPWPVRELGELGERDRVVLSQQAREDMLTFSRRVVARIGALVERGASVRLGVMSAGENPTLLAAMARQRITRALITARAHGEPVELVLLARGDSGPRHDLVGLAGALCEGAGAECSVRVRLGAVASESRELAAREAATGSW